jgi:hypothetical protein
MTDDATRCAYHESGHAVACLCLGIPLTYVTMDADNPHCMRARYRPAHAAGLECLVTMCLAGPMVEVLFCGAIADGGDADDYQMALHYLADRCPLQIGTELARLRDAAARLVALPWAHQRIAQIATALLDCGTLSAAQIEALTPTASHNPTTWRNSQLLQRRTRAEI